MCERCAELEETIRELRQALVPLEFASPREWRLTYVEDRLFRALRSRAVLTFDGAIAATRTPNRQCLSAWDVTEPSRLVSVYIHRLRRALFNARAPYLIHSVRGVGYRIEYKP